jgi:hypothetical protein
MCRSRSPPAAPGTAPSQLMSPSKVYSIRTDIHFNIDTNTMVAMLELPGVKHNELNVTLATEPYTHARQITIAGRTQPPFAEPTPEERERTKRERKYGEFLRRLQVPPHTQVCSRVLIIALPDAPERTSLGCGHHRSDAGWRTRAYSPAWHACTCGGSTNYHDQLDHCPLSIFVVTQPGVIPRTLEL